MTASTILTIAAAVMALALLNIVVNGLLARRQQRLRRPVGVVEVPITKGRPTLPKLVQKDQEPQEDV